MKPMRQMAQRLVEKALHNGWSLIGYGPMRSHRILLLKSWIVFCTTSVAAGWLLSLVGQLNLLGYVIAMSSTIALGIAVVSVEPVRWRISVHRFRKRLPLMFAIVGLFAFLGGVFYAPNNYDALTYRVPRLLQWVAVGRWNWIITANERMNYSGTNFEWLTAPLFLFSRTDRLFFVLNFIPFLFLPGLIFSTYRMLHVGGRVAWAWMWILPTSYCYALQAGSIGNDAIGAVLVLASLNFALRASQTHRISEALFSMLAIALATGLKASNLPLALPCIVALWPVRRLLLARPSLSALGVATSLLVSYLPIAILNHHFTGDCTGDPQNLSRVRLGAPFAGIVGNTLQLGTQTLQPPLLPGARRIEVKLVAMLPQRVRDILSRDFPRFQPTLGELPQEEAAGLGLAVALLLMISLLVGLFVCDRPLDRVSSGSIRVQTLIKAAAWVALISYMAKMGSESTPRLLAPYYLVLLPTVLCHPVNARLVRQTWWRSLAVVAVGSTAVVLLLTPARPLWPAETVLTRLQYRWTKNAQLARARQVYAVYRQRNDLLGPLRDYLPVDVKRVGLIADENDSDLALWRPFGSRRVFYLVGTGRWEDETQGCAWIVGKTESVMNRYGMSLEELLLRSRAQLIGKKTITSKVSSGPEEWFVLHIPRT